MKVKKIYRLFPLFLMLLFSSCSWFNNASDNNEFTLTISGTLTSQGALPEVMAERTAARTATVVTASGTLSYTVDLLASETATTALTTANATTGATNIYYEMKYTPPSDSTQTAYFLRANAKLGDTLILQSAVTPVSCNFKSQVCTQDLELRPTGTGDSTATGTVLLPVTLETPGNFTSVSIDNTSFTVDQSSLSSGTVIIKNNGSSIGAQAYPVTVSFYKSTTLSDTTTANVLVYQFTDVINVFNGLETNTWVDNGNCPHLTTTTTGGVTTTQCKITDALLEAFKTTNFYVTFGAAADGLGTFYKPFNSLEYAVKYINSVGNDTDTYTIHIQGDPVDPWDEHFSAGLQINKNITIECYKNLPGKKDGSYIISKSTDFEQIFSVSAGKTLTFESDGGRAHETDYYTNGLRLFLPGNTNGVEIAAADGSTPAGRFIMKGGRIYNGNTGVKASGIFEMYGGGISTCGTCVYLDNASSEMKVSGTPYIYGSMQIGGTPGLDVYIRVASKKIKITGPLTDGTRNALIGISKTGTPTIADPIVFTSGYGYQTGGYNAGVKPGRYFRGKDYGVTYDGDNTTPSATYGEAVLALSGGKITVEPIKDDITIDIDHTNASKNTADKVFTFTVTKDKGAVAPATPTDLTSATGISYSYTLRDHTDTLAYPTYYTKNANTITLVGNIPNGKYNLDVTVGYEGKTYTSSFDITYVDVTVPEDCVAVLGTTWTGSSTLCAGDTDRESKYFIADRKLDIPNIIACDHEVTQTEFEQYMIYDPANTDYHVAETGTDKDVYPVYYVDWYATIIYCNLRTLGDSSFGSSRAERLSHCVYSLNGSKDPESWLNSEITGTRIYKSGDKFCYGCWKNYATRDTDPTTVLDTTATSGYQFDLNADGWRLPTIVEWEYLARGGNLLPENQTIYSGTDSLEDVTAASGTVEIKQLKPNKLKLYDMSGNLTEWCWDRTFDYCDVQSNTPITGKTIGNKRVIGEPKINDYLSTYSNRGYKYPSIGFRVIRTVK